MMELTYIDVINDTLKKPLTEYKYNGKDDSILYQKVISPLCQLIVDKHLPETLAPNTITMIGFVANIFPHVLLILTDSKDSTANNVLVFLQGLCILFYSVRYSLIGRYVTTVMGNRPERLGHRVL